MFLPGGFRTSWLGDHGDDVIVEETLNGHPLGGSLVGVQHTTADKNGEALVEFIICFARLLLGNNAGEIGVAEQLASPPPKQIRDENTRVNHNDHSRSD